MKQQYIVEAITIIDVIKILDASSTDLLNLEHLTVDGFQHLLS